MKRYSISTKLCTVHCTAYLKNSGWEILFQESPFIRNMNVHIFIDRPTFKAKNFLRIVDATNKVIGYNFGI